MNKFKICIGKTFMDATFKKQSFVGYILENCKFIGCNFDELFLRESNLVNCQFTDCRFTNLETRNCRIEKISLDGAVMRKIFSGNDQFLTCTCSECCFRNIKRYAGVIKDCNFIDTFVDKCSENNSKVRSNCFSHSYFVCNKSTYVDILDNTFMECNVRILATDDKIMNNELCGGTLSGNLAYCKIFQNKAVCVCFERFLGERNHINNNELKDCEGLSQRCPEGQFLAYKKAGDCLVKLLIPADAIRYSVDGPRCRCNYAKVLSIVSLKTHQELAQVASDYDKNFIYTAGQFCKAKNFDTQQYEKFTTGIHFFIDKQDAISY